MLNQMFTHIFFNPSQQSFLQEEFEESKDKLEEIEDELVDLKGKMKGKRGDSPNTEEKQQLTDAYLFHIHMQCVYTRCNDLLFVVVCFQFFPFMSPYFPFITFSSFSFI